MNNEQNNPGQVNEEIDLSNGNGQIFYKSVLDRRSKQLDYIWETAKFSIGIIGAIYTVTVTLIGYFNSQGASSLEQIAFLPFFSLIISIWAIFNIKRQYKNLLRDITCINQIEKFLGFHKEIRIDDNKAYNEPYILPPKWVENAGLDKNRDNFIKENSKLGKSSMYTYLGSLFGVLAVLSLYWFMQLSGILTYLLDP